MLERVGTAAAILTGWRPSGSHPRERLDGTRFSLEIERNKIDNKSNNQPQIYTMFPTYVIHINIIMDLLKTCNFQVICILNTH